MHEGSISLLETSGLNDSLIPYDGLNSIGELLIDLEERTLALPPFLRRFQRWVDSSERDIDAGMRPRADLRFIFRDSIYQQILALQRDGLTDRDALAAMHEKLDLATHQFARLAHVWLAMQEASRCLLFGDLTNDTEPEDPVQPPISPADESRYEILVEEAFPFHSTVSCGVRRRRLPPDRPAHVATEWFTSAITTTLYALMFLLRIWGLL
ncbi:MAG: hypothetical protein Q9222_006662 [Ikaeria aurantiellina]